MSRNTEKTIKAQPSNCSTNTERIQRTNSFPDVNHRLQWFAQQKALSPSLPKTSASDKCIFFLSVTLNCCLDTWKSQCNERCKSIMWNFGIHIGFTSTLSVFALWWHGCFVLHTGIKFVINLACSIQLYSLCAQFGSQNSSTLEKLFQKGREGVVSAVCFRGKESQSDKLCGLILSWRRANVLHCFLFTVFPGITSLLQNCKSAKSTTDFTCSHELVNANHFLSIMGQEMTEPQSCLMGHAQHWYAGTTIH